MYERLDPKEEGAAKHQRYTASGNVALNVPTTHRTATTYLDPSDSKEVRVENRPGDVVMFYPSRRSGCQI